MRERVVLPEVCPLLRVEGGLSGASGTRVRGRGAEQGWCRVRLLRFYGGRDWFTLIVRGKFNLTGIATLAWLRPGWWGWEWVAGVLIVRAGPFVLTVWETGR